MKINQKKIVFMKRIFDRINKKDIAEVMRLCRLYKRTETNYGLFSIIFAMGCFGSPFLRLLPGGYDYLSRWRAFLK